MEYGLDDKLKTYAGGLGILAGDYMKGAKDHNFPNDQEDPEIGEARDKVDVEYDGQEFEIGFNSQYLLDFLTTVKAERICFEMKDENSAVLMRPEVEEDVKDIYVIMPMKI